MSASWNTPLLLDAAGRPELVVNVHSRLLAFDPQTGKQLWTCAAFEDYVCPSVIAHDGVVYLIGARANSAMAVKAGGSGDVTRTHVLWELNRGSNVSSPVYHDGHLYWASESRGIFYCVNAREGKAVYEERLTPGPDRIYASPVVADGKIYLVSRTRGTYVIDAKPEFKILAHNTLGDTSVFNASPAVVDGRLLLRSDRALYCIGKQR
jgi:outer membrane protein assembly factor BamB